MSETPDQEATGADSKRVRSTIKFPYGDLDDAVEIAVSIANRHGTSCSTDQLAADLNSTVTSGTYRMKLATAQTFGVVTGSRGHLTLTNLGREIADPQREGAARVEAFLTVPLYKAVYEKFQGHRLPADEGLEREIVGFGVSEKQADKARYALQRSAKQGGFFSSASDRLVRPAASTIAPMTLVEPPPAVTPPTPPSHGLDIRPDLAAEPLLVGLFNKLPKVDGPTPPEEIQAWVAAATVVLGLVFNSATVPTAVESSHGETSDRPETVGQR